MLPSCCIFRVPEVLRRQNRAAYEPNIVSIGPIHRGRPQFELVEKVKKRYFTSLLSHLEISLQDLIKRVLNELEQPARECYADTFDRLDQNKFAEMLILDGCYLIQLFLKGPVEEQEEDEQEEEAINFNSSFMLEYLYHDLLVLENQLPWLVLKFFYNLIELDNTKKPLTEMVIDFFIPLVAAEATIFSCPKSDVGIFHILDLIRTALIQEEPQDRRQSSITNKEQPNRHLPLRIPTAATLKKDGVQLKRGPQGCILNINFNVDGVFTIPPLTIDEKTDAFFRNLIAYEQCSPNLNYRITSYVVLIGNLINTSKDVDLLSEKEIVVNWLSAKDASKLFNELYKDTTINEFNYRKLCNDVDQYHKSLWGRFRKNIYRLKRDYFDTPWATISVFAAFVLLVLTFLQTIYTMLPSDPHPAPAPG